MGTQKRMAELKGEHMFTKWEKTDKGAIRIPVDLDKRRYFTLDLAAVIRWEGLTDKPFFSKQNLGTFQKERGDGDDAVVPISWG
jgi:hypothetical protein